MHILRKRAAEPKVEEAPDKDVDQIEAIKDTLIQSQVREYAQDHRAEIHRSEKSAPDRFRDLIPIRDDFSMDDFLVPTLLSGSKFSGNSVHHSNYRTFIRLYGDVPGVYPVIGGHDSFGIALKLGLITEEILETLRSMDDYASLDDEEVSKTETAAIVEAWEDWGRHDFIRALESEYPHREMAIDSLSDEDLLNLFETLRKRIGAEWVHETGNRSFIDVEPIAHVCMEEDLPTVPEDDEEPVEEDPLPEEVKEPEEPTDLE
jgi:hypothetical protein